MRVFASWCDEAELGIWEIGNGLYNSRGDEADPLPLGD
jgi:hypothetical protein